MQCRGTSVECREISHRRSQRDLSRKKSSPFALFTPVELNSSSLDTRHPTPFLVPHFGFASAQVLSGLYSFMPLAIAAVFGPRSFWKTLPSWLTTKVMTPELPYSAG